jgi:hypothetical protein
MCSLFGLAVASASQAHAAEDWNLRLNVVGLQSAGASSFGVVGFTTTLTNAPLACTNSRNAPIALFPVATEQDRALLSLATTAHIARKPVKVFYTGACMMGYAVISRIDVGE